MAFPDCQFKIATGAGSRFRYRQKNSGLCATWLNNSWLFLFVTIWSEFIASRKKVSITLIQAQLFLVVPVYALLGSIR